MNQFLQISEFAQLSGIKRKNLIYYDEIGILSPERVANNGYRLYSYRQLETVSVIGALQEVGMSLKEIKQHLDERSPEALLELFTTQRKNVEEKIQTLQRIEVMIDTRLGTTRRGLEIDEGVIEVKHCKEELLFAGEEIVCEDTEEELENAVKDFYDICDKAKITYGYPFGTMVAKKNLLKGEWHFPARYFYKIPEKMQGGEKLIKPKGLYLTGYERTSYAGPQKLYKRLFDYIKDNRLVIKGNSYEEFLLDEISVKDSENYLLQVSIQVEKG